MTDDNETLEDEGYTPDEIAVGDAVESLFTEEENEKFEDFAAALNATADVAKALNSVAELGTPEIGYLDTLNGMFGELLTNAELYGDEVPDGARLLVSAPAIGCTIVRQADGEYTISLPVVSISTDEDLLRRFYTAVTEAAGAQESAQEAQEGPEGAQAP